MLIILVQKDLSIDCIGTDINFEKLSQTRHFPCRKMKNVPCA